MSRSAITYERERATSTAASAAAAPRPKRAPPSDDVDPADAGQHAHERGRQRDVPEVAGEAGLGHQPHDDHQECGGGEQRAADVPAARADRPDERERRAEQHRRREDPRRQSEHLEERAVGERGRVGVGLVRGGGAQPVARAPVLRARTTARRWRRSRRARASGGAARPTRATARRARRTATPPAAASRRRGRAGRRRRGGRRGGARWPTGTARRGCPRSCRARTCARSRRRTAAPRRRSVRRPAAQPRAEPVGHRDGEEAAGARDEPQVGAASSPENEKTVVKRTGSGFHDGPLT